MMNKLIFAVWPGTITSKNDGQCHFIGFDDLVRLYRVPYAVCLDMSRNDEREAVDLIDLEPSFHGHYELSAEHRQLVNAWGGGKL